jgi:hypothetical protein
VVGGVDALDVHDHFNDGAHVDGVEEAILHGQGDQAARDGSMNKPAALDINICPWSENQCEASVEKNKKLQICGEDQPRKTSTKMTHSTLETR